MSPLFSEPAVSRTTPLGYIEPAVHWFTDTTRPEAEASREAVNRWYEDFPDPDGKFANRLRSENDIDHYQALDELYVHHLLRRLHDDVRYEVGDVGPDFRTYAGGVCAAGVEVLSLFQREDWTTKEKQHQRLADELNRRIPPTDGYFVDFEIEQAHREPPPRRFADFVRTALRGLPAHDNINLPERVTRADLPQAVYDRDGVRIRITFIPMRTDAPAKSDPDARIVGMGPMIGGMVNAAERLKERIVAKAGGRYDIADVPFAIAVGIHDTMCTEEQIIEALYGGESVAFDPDGVEEARLVRRNDGVFGADKERPEGRHRRVSGVVVLSSLRVWETPAADIAVYDNPYAARSVPEDLFKATRRFGPTERSPEGIRFDWL